MLICSTKTWHVQITIIPSACARDLGAIISYRMGHSVHGGGVKGWPPPSLTQMVLSWFIQDLENEIQLNRVLSHIISIVFV